MAPLGVELAGRTESAIRHFKENPQYLYAPAYTDHLTAIWERSDEMKETVDTFLEFAETQQKLQQPAGKSRADRIVKAMLFKKRNSAVQMASALGRSSRSGNEARPAKTLCCNQKCTRREPPSSKGFIKK